jgi:hypothetical protein
MADLPSTPFTQARVATGMLLLHGVFAAGHVSRWLSPSYAAYVQQTREGQVVLNFPTLAAALPQNAMLAVPCGHYGCVEVTTYYRLVDPALRDRGVTFVRFSWSEWDEPLSSVPLVDPKAPRTRPLCVLLAFDAAKLRELGLQPEPVAREPAKVLGRRFVSNPLHCLP